MTIAYNEKTGEAQYLNKDGQWEPSKVVENPETGERLAFDGKGWQPVAAKPEKGWLESAYDTVTGIGDSARSAMSFGVSDYIKGGATDLARMVTGYEEPRGLEQSRLDAKDQRRQFAQENPKTDFAASVVGGMANPLNIKLGKYVMGAKGMLPTMGRSAIASGTATGLQTLGEAEGGVIDRLKQGGVGAGIGAGVGLVAPPLVKGTTKLIGATGRLGQNLANRMVGRGSTVPKRKALRKVSESLADDGLTPQQATEKAASFGPEGKIVDSGDNTRALVHRVAMSRGKGKADMMKQLIQRQEGQTLPGGQLKGSQSQRIMKFVDDLTPDSYYDKKVAHEAQRKFLGGHYEASKTADDLVDISNIVKSLDDDIYRSKGGIANVLKKVRKLLHDPKGHQEIDVQALHQAKMGIDEMMTSGKAGMTSMGKISKKKLIQYQKQIVEAIEESGEAGKLYRAGRMGTAGEWRLEEAMEEGLTFRSTKDPKALQIYLKGLTPEEHQAFKVGVVKSINDRLGNMKITQDSAKELLDTPAMRQKLEMVFKDKGDFMRLVKAVQGEKEMFKAYAKLGGSHTAEKQQAFKDADFDPGALAEGVDSLKKGNIPGAIIKAFRGVKDAVFDPEPFNRELAEAIMSREAPKGLTQSFNTLQRGIKLDRGLINLLNQGITPQSTGRLSGDLQNRRKR